MPEVATLRVKGPYDLPLSLRAVTRFSPHGHTDTSVLRSAVRVAGMPVLMKVQQRTKNPPLLEVSGPCPPGIARLTEVAKWILLTDLDLRPFYRMTKGDAKLGPISKQLHGLKPMRTPSLFEMAVIAITEQQISLAAAHRIRARVVERFGDQIDGLWAFPQAETLAQASPREFRACGLSQRKSEYISAFARRVAERSLDLNAFTTMPDDEIRAAMAALRGFGTWSADYFLIRGLGRPDCVPADDLAVRRTLGGYLGDGDRMTAAQVRKGLEPYAPFRGIATFYLLAHARLRGSLGDRPRQ